MSFKEFQDGRPWRPSWISERNDFSNFESLCHCDASPQVSAQSEKISFEEFRPSWISERNDVSNFEFVSL